MRRKRLNIIFFSVLMLAVTPRVMSNFNSYADAMYQKAEAEWLHFLVSFAHAEESEKNTATPTQAQEESPCPLQMAESAQPSTPRPVLEAKKNSKSPRSRVRSFDFTLAVAPAGASRMELAVDDLAFDWKVSRHVNGSDTKSVDPLGIDHDGRAATEYLKTLIRSLKLRDGKAVRLVQRELVSLSCATTPSIASSTDSDDKSLVQSLEIESDLAGSDTNVNQDSSDISTLDAQ